MLVKNIHKLCKDNNLTIASLEKRIGLGNGTIYKWQRSSPRVENLKAVADYFGITVDELLASD